MAIWLQYSSCTHDGVHSTLTDEKKTKQTKKHPCNLCFSLYALLWIQYITLGSRSKKLLSWCIIMPCKTWKRTTCCQEKQSYVKQKQEYTLREHNELPNHTLFFTRRQDAMSPNLVHVFILSHSQSVKEHTQVKYPEGPKPVCLIRHQMSLYGVCWENQAALTGDGPAHKKIDCVNAVEWNRYLRMITASHVVGCIF